MHISYHKGGVGVVQGLRVPELWERVLNLLKVSAWDKKREQSALHLLTALVSFITAIKFL